MRATDHIRALSALAACLGAASPHDGLTEVRADEDGTHLVLTLDGRMAADRVRRVILAVRDELGFEDPDARVVLTVAAAALQGLDGELPDGEVAAAVAELLGLAAAALEKRAVEAEAA